MEHINFGCFKNIREGFVNVDINEPADVIMDMRKYSPKEVPIFIQSRWSLGFLEDPYDMLDKIMNWVSEGGEFYIIVREQKRIEKFIQAHKSEEEKIRKGQMLYGEGILRKHYFAEKELLDYIQKAGFNTECYYSGPDIKIHAFKYNDVKADEVIWVTGYPGVGKTSLMYDLLETENHKYYHEIGGNIIVGCYPKKEGRKKTNGMEAYKTRLHSERIKVACSTGKKVLYECVPWSKIEHRKIEEYCLENNIKLTTIILGETEKILEERFIERKCTEVERGHQNAFRKKIDKINGERMNYDTARIFLKAKGF